MISLSNLLKQHYVINLETERRVINSEQLYNERHAETVSNVYHVAEQSDMETGSEEVLDNFLAGLEVEEVIPEPQITPEELLEQAQLEADAILATAQAEALRITDDAQREAQLLLEQKRAEGYQAGVSQMEAELDAEKNRMQQELADLKQNLQQEYDSRLATMEEDIVSVLIPVFNKVFGIQFDNKKDMLLYLIHNTLMNESDSKQYRIRVSAENFKHVESGIEEIKEKIGKDVSLEVISDMTLSEEACLIETESGVFDCGIDTQLNNLMKDIQSLC